MPEAGSKGAGNGGGEDAGAVSGGSSGPVPDRTGDAAGGGSPRAVTVPPRESGPGVTPAGDPAAGGGPHPAPRTLSPTSSLESGPGPASSAGRRTGLLVTLVLGALTGLPPLSMDIYLPALPAVTESLSAPAATVQLTLTACIAGMALGQLLVGPLSDRYGRRRPLLAGMSVYVVATVVCALAPSAELLIAFRLLQGLAGAAGLVIARAVVRDLYDGVEMARFFSTLMLISGVAPIIAPVIGGQVLRVTDWRGIFAVLAVVGILLTLVVLKWLPETLVPERRQDAGVRQALRTMRDLFGDRTFAGYTLTGGLSFAVMFAYIAASPFVIQEIYGASAQMFSLLFGVNALGLVAVGQFNGRVLVGRVSLDKVLATGLGVMLLAAVALLLMTTGVFGDPGLFGISAGLFVLTSSIGLVMPNTNALALIRAPHAAGSASALIGTSAFLIGAAASPLVGVAGEHTAVPMALVQLGCGLAAALCFLGLCRPWRRVPGDAAI
jgi:MFS transporter, DHA1 family, multidrug resistance protein